MIWTWTSNTMKRWPAAADTASMSGWDADAEMAKLVRWFGSAELPQEPFDLVSAGMHPMCCIRVLDAIATGWPGSYRAEWRPRRGSAHRRPNNNDRPAGLPTINGDGVVA